MPITEELKNLKKFESVGFSHDQAATLAETIEDAQASSHENLKEFIRTELDNKINSLDIRFNSLDIKFNSLDIKFNSLNDKIDGLDNKIDNKISELRYELKSDIATSSKDLLIKIFAIIFGTSGMLFGMLKLFG